jgi:hypothetical protein
VSAGRGNQGGRGEIGACPELRTSRQSSPWQRARRGSDVDGETGSGRQRAMAAPPWRVRSAGVGGLKRGSAGAQMREGESEQGSGTQVAEGGAVASSTRDVGAEFSVCAAREGGYAGTRELTEGAHEQRDRGSGRTRGVKRRRRQGGPARTERGRGERARAGWAGWAERPRGTGVRATLLFSFIPEFVFPFPFIYSI